jgi:conjugal transfer pilus assembly protein TraB
MSDPNSKTKQTQTLILGGVVVSIFGLVTAGMFLFEPEQKQVKPKPVVVNLTPPGTVDDRDAWRASESQKGDQNTKSILELQQKTKAAEDANRALKKELDDIKAGKVPQPLSTTPPKESAAAVAVLSQQITGQQQPKPGQVLQPPQLTPAGPGKASQLNQPINGNQPPQPSQRDVVEMITFGNANSGQPGAPDSTSSRGGDQASMELPINERANTTAGPEQGKAGAGKSGGIEFIPAGSFVRVAMLNGVDAPTGGQAQSNPLPMAFQVLDTANLANKYRLDIKDCRFIAAAWGDLSSERTFGRTETLTCIIDGETVEMPVRGSVIGEDGKAGIRGRLVTKQGQLLANALFAGALSGIGKAFQQAATVQTIGGGGVTQTIDPDRVGAAAIGGGVGSAANMLASYYLKAAEKMFPVIETDGGRVVEILVTKGAIYKGGAGKRDQYKGLLRRSSETSRTNDED